MKLYYSPAACSLAVHILFHELGVAFEAVQVDLTRHTMRDGGDFYAISPRGYVPVLELDDGTRYTEGVALLQYVADLDPQQALIGPIGSRRRLEVTQWLAFVSTELHKSFSPCLWDKTTASSTQAAVMKKLAARFGELDQRLATQDYLAEAFSVADIYAFTILNWTAFLSIPLDSYPHLQRYLQRVSQRPAALAALKAEGLLK
ncbi:glutathione S-transferase [Chitinivorax tropicus]|uniref:Glutathione S-transferase n=1 Tax=Chitinivorax tropicus TaxID=714531 RepID=A0A840MJD8_9PROT|nr:glutathione transferase GstA [Chitinivorax tropicus]MBB5019314.1 glutathione S-transferase [Chitinivorax tropicus]